VLFGLGLFPAQTALNEFINVPLELLFPLIAYPLQEQEKEVLVINSIPIRSAPFRTLPISSLVTVFLSPTLR